MQDTNRAQPANSRQPPHRDEPADRADPAQRRASAVRRWLPAIAVVVLLGLAGGAAALSSPSATELPLAESAPRTPPMPTDVQLPSQQQQGGGDGRRAALELPAWVAQLALFVCMAIALTTIAVLVWSVIRDQIAIRRGALVVERGASPSQQRKQDVVAALDAGLDELSDLDADPRRAVIACWVRLEHAAAAAGTPRHVGDTPTELVLRLLGAHQVDRRVLDRFAGIYREARYATHTVDTQMRTDAIGALRQLRRELTVRAFSAAGEPAAGAAATPTGAAGTTSDPSGAAP